MISCISNQSLACGNNLPDYKSAITVTDNKDSNPVITQSPVAGSVFYPGMTVTITAQDNAENKTTCSFLVNGKQLINCPINQSLHVGALFPDYTKVTSTT